MNNADDRAIAALDAIFDDAALYEAEHGEITARDREWADALRTRTHERLAQLRRNLVEKSRPTRRKGAVRGHNKITLRAASSFAL
jgi:hypothetical protein